ncbi:unnamed protein product [Phaeothamnion confervicola]
MATVSAVRALGAVGLLAVVTAASSFAKFSSSGSGASSDVEARKQSRKRVSFCDTPTVREFVVVAEEHEERSEDEQQEDTWIPHFVAWMREEGLALPSQSSR